VSYTRIGNLEAGFGFGRDFDRRDQVRALIETGILLKAAPRYRARAS
jgi:hypothetical protein